MLDVVHQASLREVSRKKSSAGPVLLNLKQEIALSSEGSFNDCGKSNESRAESNERARST